MGSFANSTASATNMNSSSQQGSFLSPELLNQMGLYRETNKSLSSNRIKNRAISNDFSRNDDMLRNNPNQIKIQPFEAQAEHQLLKKEKTSNVVKNGINRAVHHKKAYSMNKEFAYSMKSNLNSPMLTPSTFCSNSNSKPVVGTRGLGYSRALNKEENRENISPNIYNLATGMETPRDLNFFQSLEGSDKKGPKREFLRFTFDALYGSTNKSTNSIYSKDYNRCGEEINNNETGEVVSEEGEEVITRGSEKQIISILPADFPHTIRNNNSLNNSVTSSLNETPNRSQVSQASEDDNQEKRIFSNLNLKKSPKRLQQQRTNYNKRMSRNSNVNLY